MFNTLLFKKNEEINPEYLIELDSNLIHFEKGKSSKRARDLIKLSKNKPPVILGLEGQSYIDYSLPVRTMMYDVINYNSLIQQIRSRAIKRNHFYRN